MKNALKFILALTVMLLVMLAVRAWAFTIYHVTTSDFHPEVRKGDRMIVNRLGCTYDKGEYIVFGNEDAFIGKVKAVPGDTVNITGKDYLLPTRCPLCGSKEHRYYMVSVGKQQTLIHQADIIGAAYRVWPVR